VDVLLLWIPRPPQNHNNLHCVATRAAPPFGVNGAEVEWLQEEEEEGDPLAINDLQLWVFLLCFTHPPTEAFQTINCGPFLISHRSHMPPTHQEGTDRRPAAEEAVASVATRPRQQFHWKSSPRRHPVGHPRPPTGQQIRWGSRVHWQSA
jgi:hypothetical protein